MANVKLLRGNVTIFAAYPEAFADFDNPTVAELNGPMVFNVSCAVEDSYTMNLSGSETDDSMSVCDVSQVTTPTMKNYEVSLDGFRDADPEASGYYNLFFQLFKAKGIPFIMGKRIGKPNTEPFAITDIVSLYDTKTDNPVDLIDRNTPVRLGARFKAQGRVNPEFELVA